jgi:DNA-binding transcriptional regulator YiaG
LPPVGVSTVALDVAATVCGGRRIKRRTQAYQIIQLSDIEVSDFNHHSSDHSMRAAAKWVQPEHYQIVGTALAVARRKTNLTQVELAWGLGKPQSVVSAYEAGNRRVDVVEFLLIVRTLGADPLDVFREILRSLSR